MKNLFLRQKNSKGRGIFKSPLFWFGLVCVALFFGIYASADSFASFNSLSDSRVVFFNSFFNSSDTKNNDLFISQQDTLALETPDLKIMQDNTLGNISTPSVVSAKTLGDVFGSTAIRKDIIDYVVQAGDTLQSVADFHKISVNTLIWANDLTSSSKLKAGQTLTILPTDGVLHVAKSGDNVSAMATKYKANAEEIIAFNSLKDSNDIYIGDILIIPSGTMPKSSSLANNNQIPLANNFFIYPTNGRITQGLHFYNAIDVANKCGTPIYATASGTVQRAVYNNAWNLGMGNYVTILHSNGTVTYYGHFQNVFVKPGDKVNMGDRIGLMGRTGNATGCHVHFQVVGATNPLSRFSVGATINLK